ncbi:MAG: hypothetical protein ABJB11_18620 [Ferruginibacter sp.]
MTNIVETIKDAISQKRELSLTIKYGVGQTIEIDIEPYVYGQDLMQYEFVWGYLPHSMTFYKLLIDHIEQAIITNEEVPVDNEKAMYIYSMGEEHHAIIEGFDNIYLSYVATT